MPGDWNKPTLTDLYTDVLNQLDERMDDSATMFVSTSTNQPVGSMRYVRASNKFQEWNGTTWVDKVLSVAGGGTGGATSGAAIAALGLGTMSLQNANAVAVTGGTASGLTALGLSGAITFASDNAFAIGTNAARASVIYLRSGLVVPVGTDKFVTG